MTVYDINGNPIDIENQPYKVTQLERRIAEQEKNDPFVWGTFDKAYFVFVHDDTNAFLANAYTAFHGQNAPLGAATIVTNINNTIGAHTAKEWLDLIVADGGEVLMHYNYDLTDDVTDEVWYQQVIAPKITLENLGFEVNGLILANSSTRNSTKGQKFCQEYYTYADKVGQSLRFNLGRTLMLNFDSLAAFKAEIDTRAATPGLYAYGFHGIRTDESWITESNLTNIIQYIRGKSNTEITTYKAVFDAIGMSNQNKELDSLVN